MHSRNKCFLRGWSSFSSRCHCEVINTKMNPLSEVRGAGWRAGHPYPAEWRTRGSEQGILSHPPQPDKKTVFEDTATGLFQCLVGVGLLSSPHLPCPWLPAAHEYHGWGAAQNTSLLLAVKYLEMYTQWILPGFSSKAYFFNLDFCCVMKSLVWQLWDWFSRAIRCSGLWLYSCLTKDCAWSQEARFENVSIILCFVAAKLKNSNGCRTTARFDSFINLHSGFMFLLLKQFSIHVSEKFSHNSLYEQFNYANYYLIVTQYKPQVDLDIEMDEEFLTALFL